MLKTTTQVEDITVNIYASNNIAITFIKQK